MCVHVGDSLPSVAASRDSFQRAFDPLEEVAHKGLEAAAAAATGGLAYHDPAPLLNPARLPTSEASASYLSAFKYHQLVKKEGDLSVLAPTHVDGGLLTVVYTTQPGLQVRGFGAGGQWIDVPPATDDQCRLVVLVGGQLERATGGALKPVEHRVVKINDPDEDVAKVKTLIWNKGGIPDDGQRLVSAGHQLESARKLSSYGIGKESTIHLMLRLAGDLSAIWLERFNVVIANVAGVGCKQRERRLRSREEGYRRGGRD